MAQPSDVNVDDLRRRARRRLVGAIVLALAAAVFVPMLLESEPKPLGEDVSVKIPPVDNGKFVNKLNAKGGDVAKGAVGKSDAPKVDGPKADAQKADPSKVEASKAAALKAEGAPADPAAILAVAPTGGTPSVPASNVAPLATAPASSAAEPPRKSLAEAEQKVLNAPGKTPVAPPAALPAVKSAAAPAETSKSDATQSESAKSEPAKADPVKGATDNPGFSVQLAAFSDDKGANSMSNKLKRAGYEAYTEAVTNSKGTLWRVRVGPFPTREAAGVTRDKLKGDGYSGIVAPAK